MGTKNDPGKFDCMARAEPDEPVFVLLGRDRSASELVYDWAERRETEIRHGHRPLADMHQVWEARDCADAMADFASDWNDCTHPRHKQAAVAPERAPFAQPTVLYATHPGTLGNGWVHE